MSLSRFRSRSNTEMIDAAIQLARQHYARLFALSVIVAIPSIVLEVVILWLMQLAPGDAPGSQLLLVSPVVLVAFCWFWIGGGALVGSLSAGYVEMRAIEPLTAIRIALRRAGALIGGNFLAWLRIAIGLVFAMLIVTAAGVVTGLLFSVGGAVEPGIVGIGVAALAFVAGTIWALMIFARYANVTAIVMLEDLRAFASVRRARELSSGHTRRIAGLMLLLVVLYGACYVTVALLANAMFDDDNMTSVVASVAMTPLYPFVASVFTLLYYDLRIRREGFDIELMTRELDASTPSAAPPNAHASFGDPRRA